MPIKLNGLQHIGIPVTDLNRSEKFYESLGFTNVMSAGFELQGEKGHVAMMQQGSLVIELYQMPPTQLEEVKQRGNGRIDHFAFDVDDVELTYKQLKESGFEPLEAEPVRLNFWSPGVRFFFILGPDGERIEFNQIL